MRPQTANGGWHGGDGGSKINEALSTTTVATKDKKETEKPETEKTNRSRHIHEESS